MTERDKELSRRFTELRRTDETSAPAFREAMAWDVAHARRHSGRRLRRTTLVMATAVVALIAFGIFRKPGTMVVQPGESLAEWRAKSDVLLAEYQYRSPLFEMMPPLSSSVLNAILP